MQTELKTAKDEKLVDLDTSGEGAEIELEDKSHGAVAPDKYEEIKTEEKDPLQPAVQEQAEEMDQYSDKVKKRIDKLTFKVREAEREREAATWSSSWEIFSLLAPRFDRSISIICSFVQADEVLEPIQRA